MKLTDLIKEDLIVATFMLNHISQLDLQVDDIGILSSDIVDGVYKLEIDNKVLKISIKDFSVKQELNFQLLRNNANLTQVIWIQDNQCQLKTFFFRGSSISLPKIQIGITDNAMSQAKKKGIKTIEHLSDNLNNDCLIKVNGETYVCARISTSLNDKDEQINDISDELLNSITIYGATYRLPIVQKELIAGISQGKKLLLHTLQPNSKKDNIHYQLVKVEIEWVLESESKAISGYVQNKLDILMKDNSSYFKVWDDYIQKESELLANKELKVGNIEVNNVEPCENGFRIYVDKDLRGFLNTGDSLEVISKQYLRELDEEMEFFDEEMEFSDEDNPLVKQKNNTIVTKIMAIAKEYIEVDSVNINNGHILKLSTYGDAIQVERRKKARERILKGESANPNLGLIIEGSDTLPLPNKPLRPIVLNQDIEKRIFKYGATPTQKRAVEFALNTPDIMLIQGPPGTGKTTVITAILEQLNLLQDKKSNISGTVLISAFQHDAVDNLANKLLINDIPVIKFSSNDDHKQRNFEEINKWAKQIIQYIDEKQPHFNEMDEWKAIDELMDAYKFSPSRHQAISLLNAIKHSKKIILSRDDEQELDRILKELSVQTVSTNNTDFSLVGSIRTTETGFFDDGLNILIKVKDRFSDDLSEDNIELLEKIINTHQSLMIQDILIGSKKIKKELLDVLNPIPKFSISKPRRDILKLLDSIYKDVQKNREYVDKKEQILFDFRNELQTNPYRLAKALESYNSIYASTVQQSDGNQIRQVKQAYADTAFLSYDTVVVDEAARVGAMDLLIPMSQAKNRIILVGDHRQLPHMIEEAIVQQISDNEEFDSDMVNNYLKNSIFEYLFELLKKMEQRDGIVRTITLDAQYRSHPLLGKFASDNFYKPYKESYESPTPATDYQHELQGIENKAAIWLNVPHQAYETSEKKQGTSRYRDIEVDRIVERLVPWLTSKEGEDLSFGVISFYSAQVEKIKEKLKSHGIDLEQINCDKERLRIGTVDAFQGMEFDIVFLSMVRTISENRLSKLDENDIKVQTRLFGHLMSKNRLCVAVTRQKRALIMVGDARMVDSNIGRQAVPELGNFLDLCKNQEQGIIL